MQKRRVLSKKMHKPNTLFLSMFSFSLIVYFWERGERESKQGRGRERGRHRVWSRLQALSCQHRAQEGARTHRLWDLDLSWRQMLNPLSHPGAPSLILLIEVVKYFRRLLSVKVTTLLTLRNIIKYTLTSSIIKLSIL